MANERQELDQLRKVKRLRELELRGGQNDIPDNNLVIPSDNGLAVEPVGQGAQPVTQDKGFLDSVKLSRCEDTIGDFATKNYLRIMVGKNNYYYMRDMEDRVITKEVFEELMEMIPEMVDWIDAMIKEDQ